MARSTSSATPSVGPRKQSPRLTPRSPTQPRCRPPPTTGRKQHRQPRSRVEDRPRRQLTVPAPRRQTSSRTGRSRRRTPGARISHGTDTPEHRRAYPNTDACASHIQRPRSGPTEQGPSVRTRQGGQASATKRSWIVLATWTSTRSHTRRRCHRGDALRFRESLGKAKQERKQAELDRARKEAEEYERAMNEAKPRRAHGQPHPSPAPAQGAGGRGIRRGPRAGTPDRRSRPSVPPRVAPQASAATSRRRPHPHRHRPPLTVPRGHPRHVLPRRRSVLPPVRQPARQPRPPLPQPHRTPPRPRRSTRRWIPGTGSRDGP